MTDQEFNNRKQWVDAQCEYMDRMESRKKTLIAALETIGKHCCFGYSMILCDLAEDVTNHPLALAWTLHTLGVLLLSEASKLNDDEVVEAGKVLFSFVEEAHVFIKEKSKELGG